MVAVTLFAISLLVAAFFLHRTDKHFERLELAAVERGDDLEAIRRDRAVNRWYTWICLIGAIGGPLVGLLTKF